ncbi:MAG: response regulator, partial [Lachnospiraceae bacterium]|nr:response regulator [Lachnospiraceae bacterium]
MSRLLIVEDDMALSESVALALETAGFLVFTANTVNEAKKMLDSSDYDLLLLDVNLPDGSGHDVLA